MACSLSIKLDSIRQGLRTFDSTFFQAPGRMNVFNEHPFKVLFDHGHNAHAVGAMADLAQLQARNASEGRARNPSRRPPAADAGEEIGTHEAGDITEQLMPGVIRDERGVWIVPETEA